MKKLLFFLLSVMTASLSAQQSIFKDPYIVESGSSNKLSSQSYVNSVVGGKSAFYLRGDQLSSITNAGFGGAYYKLARDVSSTRSYTNNVTGITNNQYVVAFATDTGVPTFSTFQEGLYIVEWDCFENAAGSLNLRPELYIRNAGGSEYYEFPNAETITVPTAQTHVRSVVAVTTNLILASTDRLVLKLKATVTGGTPQCNIVSGLDAISVVRVDEPNANFVRRAGDTVTGPLNFTGGIQVQGVLAIGYAVTNQTGVGTSNVIWFGSGVATNVTFIP